MTETLNPKLALVAAHCTRRGWRFSALPNRPVIKVNYNVGGVRWSAFVKAEEHDSYVVVRAVHPEPIAPEHRAAVMEFITRVNFGILVGNFELDLVDGELRFKTSLQLNGGELTDAMVGGLFDANNSLYPRYRRYLLDVIEGTSNPEEAFVEAEGR